MKVEGELCGGRDSGVRKGGRGVWLKYTLRMCENVVRHSVLLNY